VLIKYSRYQGFESSFQSAKLKAKLDEVASSNIVKDHLAIGILNMLESFLGELSLHQELSHGSLESRASGIESLTSERPCSDDGSGRANSRTYSNSRYSVSSIG
jgi:hypothetical protein